MTLPADLKLSLLDLVAVREGGDAAEAIALAVRTARHVEALGFTRLWLAEHHNMPGIASSATAVLIGHIAGATERIRVGSGGIMLPNHAPLMVAEAFGTLEAIYPGRIDLGLGRAPGTDQLTLRALRRDRIGTEADFPREVIELIHLLNTPDPGQAVVAVPGSGSHVPIWLLGSSLFSASLAAQLGLPYAFAAHFAPRMLNQALQVYRSQFQPSAALDAPYVIVGVPVVGADSDEEARYLTSSVQQRVLGIVRGERSPLRPPVADFMTRVPPQEREAIDSFLGAAIVGGPDTLRAGFEALHARTRADEFMLVSDVFDVDLRLRSLSLAAAAAGLGRDLPTP
ncbi:LLM class flavin-dependent oxidoreductase [Nitrogeniibacter mangrovi]|uniref:Luciferase-like monooxygenase n=1 Tax=Nitrogeniibacter mangrovi TaxID=2016596 RepID=A0A6C1AY88_9RHOO|nr:LLM class flavin-dependent oxidoreductase [Nitrogeniibacter mangrovi]QID16331.1 LLM class flavin-dependent oxidoreductase [Nitrogeniibacter mangrovi]